jgi:hypothetical protein
MKRSFFTWLSLFALVAVVGPTSAFAGRIKIKGTTPAPTPAPTLISNVTANAVTIGDDKTTKTFTISQFTEIYLNGQKASIAELKRGMVVSVRQATDPTRASRIDANGAPAEDHGKKKKKK